MKKLGVGKGVPVVDKSFVKGVRNYLRALQDQGLIINFGVGFGSQIRGIPGSWRDIDLLVVSPRFDDLRDRADIDLLWRVAARTDNRIEPIPCGERQWREEKMIPIPHSPL